MVETDEVQQLLRLVHAPSKLIVTAFIISMRSIHDILMPLLIPLSFLKLVVN